MSIERRGQRHFASSTERVVTLPRRASRTVSELAAARELSDNAVRAQLATLERDGLVRQEREWRGGGTPSLDYGLTPDAEALFPKAHGAVLRSVVAVVDGRLGPEETEAILREAGSRLATPPPADASPEDRTRLAVAVIDELGGLAELEDRGDHVLLRGFACPLADVVAGAPDACRIAQALLSEATGLQLRERCDREDPHVAGLSSGRLTLRPPRPIRRPDAVWR
jgi:predicted ArsR family transcriptional regulator